MKLINNIIQFIRLYKYIKNNIVWIRPGCIALKVVENDIIIYDEFTCIIKGTQIKPITNNILILNDFYTKHQ